MDRGHEISGKLVISCGNAPEILKPAEAALDDVPPLVGALVEGMELHAIGFIRDDRPCAGIDDFGTQFVAVIPLVGNERTHGRCERQNIGRGSDVGLLAGGEMKNDGPAERITQRMDFRRAAAARTADCLIVLPPFPPEAQR
jgi:hypothetical protein